MSFKYSRNLTSPQSKSASSLKKNTSERPSSVERTPYALFLDFQNMKCENLREINTRKQKELVLFQKLMSSLKDSKDFIVLEEKYQDKKREHLRNLEEKVLKSQEKIEKVCQENSVLKMKIQSKDLTSVFSEHSQRGNEGVVPDELFKLKVNPSSVNRIHSDVAKIVENNRIEVASLCKAILDLQQRRLRVLKGCEKLKSYREDLQKSLNT